MKEYEAKALVEWLKVKKGKTLKQNDDAIDLVIEALEKQIAKKVIVPPCNYCENELCDCECVNFGKTWVDNFKCPTCYSENVCILDYDIRHDYCNNCGQKLDWSV